VIRLRTFLLRNACMGNDRLLELSSTEQANALIENKLCAQRSIGYKKTLVTIEDGF
jgi:hypothetical protein